MKTTIINTPEAKNKAWAVMDARQRNLNNKSSWSAKDQLRAERMSMALSVLYYSLGNHISYGKKGISVKLDHPQVLRADDLVQLEAEWSREGVTKTITPQAVIYKFK